ncbi:hypothetical protein CVU83_03440 [Candidatus Falkowbacteria bacterium HGW-Falkowbacteria-2]|uniref:DUF4342 domain-containing protein n=1 Tax=Candidatus Falkowbacteria bacterium HGW-Falkowbacteria-2 TaxID=2013769 RepID=A0A2N2DX84_9BACT|nr:MAG: hypothetical protein CVU83_03440 [Candidatus Falkowbacteria bacterium HGW-Falkowbacteria-2]
MPAKKTKSSAGGKKANSSSANDSQFEEFSVMGHELVEKVKKLIKEGNVRRIIIKNEKGKVMLEIPVTFAVIGAVFAPVLAAVGALAALLNKGSIVVVKK